VLDGLLRNAGLLDAGQSLANVGKQIFDDGTYLISNSVEFAAAAGTRAVVQGGVSTLINGGSFENAFLSSFVNNLSPGIANEIGNSFNTTHSDGSTNWSAIGSKAIVHAASGCALAALQRADCGAGAIGAGVGEFSAEVYGNVFNVTNRETLLASSRLTAIAVTAAVGKENLAGTADFFASNAVANNYLNHNQVNKLQQELEKCGTDQACRNRWMQWATSASMTNDVTLANCTITNNCDTLTREFREGSTRIIELQLLGKFDEKTGNFASGLQANAARIQNNPELRSAYVSAFGCTNPTDACYQRAQTLLGFAATAAFLTPGGASFGLILAGKEIANGNGEKVVHDVLLGLRDVLPDKIYQNLNSDDPYLRGKAVGDALALGSITSVVARKLLNTEGLTLSPSARAGIESATNPLLVDSMPRNGTRTVLDQGMAPTCGHNSCGMVLDTLGKPVDVAALIERVPPSREGILSSDVARALKTEGVDAIFWDRRSVGDLAQYTQGGTPVVVRIVDSANPSALSHFVVVDGVTTRNGIPVVAIRDPNGLQYFSPVSTFIKNFTGEVIVPKLPGGPK
jgi:hypothetical protein